MGFLLSFLIRVVLPLSALWKTVVTGGLGYLLYRKRRLREATRIATPAGVDALERVVLGGTGQWISIRGHDRRNPVLLFLHGGPGLPEGPLVRHFNRRLEDAFVVVHWDQRGAGKSFSRGAPPGSIRLEQFVADTCELASALGRRFGQEKICLVGHSWGSLIGILAAQRQPELFHAFIGVGQLVDCNRGEALGYRQTLALARAQGATGSVHRLERLGPPPYRGRAAIAKTLRLRGLVFRFGGAICGETSEARHQWRMLKLYLLDPDYSPADIIRALWGLRISLRRLWADLQAVNLLEQVPRLAVPVHFLAGRHDRVTPGELVQAYCDRLEAPFKQVVWFERSGHSPNYEEPERFLEVMTVISGQARPER